jgi:tritrans,polycis-undecaprenyl-diphosphate synthase [geranylgeranyl-diphosphate specific]
MERLQVPNHLGVILDGNRRWARLHGMQPWEGHRYGAQKLEEFLNWCVELGIPQVSVYILSTENLNRPKRELEELFKLFYEYFEKWEKEKESFLEKYQVKVRFIGDLERLPPKLVRLMGKIMRKTAKYQKRVLNIMIAYGSKFELTQAIKKIAEKAIKLGRIEISEKDIEANLLVPTPLDLVIRTGGFSRLSNFMLIQAAYAEIFTTKVLWPDFSKKDLIKAIKWYNSVQRNFGK